MQINCLIILCFLFTFTGIAESSPDLLGDYVPVNCGSTAASTALNGRQWLGDAYPKLSSSLTIKGSSTRSSVHAAELMTSVDPVPYKTARVSRYQFSYTFQLNPGQKFIRLHFNPASYDGFPRFNDFFTVEAGPFTLLSNFSASVTADALAVTTLTKEFCVIIQENQPLDIVFSPATGPSKYTTYAFINGIEIISVPSSISYCHDGDIGVQVVGHKSVIYIDNTTALELVHRQNIKWASVSSGDDITGMFGMWATIVKEKANKVHNMTWRIAVDVGFRYLVRIHFCELGLKMVDAGSKDLTILINHMIASTGVNILQEKENEGILVYKNYMVMMEGQKREGKRDISISLRSKHEFLERHGPLEGFEVFKLSNHDYSLASPNPPPPRRGSPFRSIQVLLSLLGRRNAIATLVFTTICLVNIIVHILQHTWGANPTKEESKPSASAKRLCRRFSLAEIQSATHNFQDTFLLGKGGFGKVYIGSMDNGLETVAIKRLKPDSKQGKREFWTEVEMLSELRHVNLVPLFGYCNEQREMILVYEYMPSGTLADHLHKLPRKIDAFSFLTWKQRLKICIGAGRGLDYLHTGCGIIHRDVKASNILLDEKFVAKISDFGLAKTESGSELQSQASTNLKGTFGYIDPNYFRTRKLTTKSDTYSFGVVLLEVLCGRPAVEPRVEEDERSLTMWARDNISKGHVDQIVAPSLRGEISPDSLKTFVRIAEKCLLDEPRKRPAIAHVVVKLEIALEQQENSESLAPRERASVADFFPSIDKSQKGNLNSLIPKERANVPDVLPHENERSFLSNEITNVADAMPCTNKPQHEEAQSSSPNEKTSVADALAGGDRTTFSVSTRLTAASSNVQHATSLLREQINSDTVNSGEKDVRKSTMHKLSQKLWPWDAFWKPGKSSKFKDLVSHVISAPISRTDTSQHGKAKSLSPNDQKTSVVDALPGNDRTILSVRTRKTAASSNLQNVSSPPREQVNSNVINSGKKNEKKSTMHQLSRKLWPWDAFWKTRKLLKKKDLARHALSAPISSWASYATVRGSSVSETKIGTNELISSPILRIFSFSELKAATRNFRNDTVIGEGGFGKVYKGLLKENSTSKNGSMSFVAIKKLNTESMQGLGEWQAEVNILGKFSHPNLVKLLGYCWEDKELLLVYEFMRKGSLENHLFARNSAVQPLPWDIRVNILIGAARGLAFLHGSESRVIYRDFKASNILLDESYHAKLTDFGLAKLGPTSGNSHVTTQVMGTYGYAAPEYIATGHLYVKSDVYGFGVVLVETLTGLRALDLSRPSGKHNLIEWIRPYLSQRRGLKKIVDSRLEGRYPTKSAVEIAQLARNCLESDPKNRPSMQEVVETLERMDSSAVEKPRQPPRVVHFSHQADTAAAEQHL